MPRDETMSKTKQEREELEDLSKDELIELVLKANQAEAGRPRSVYRREVGTRPFDLMNAQWDAESYIRLPDKGKLQPESDLETPWRISLVSYDLSHPIIGLELVGDVVVGRGDDGKMPDLDLTPCNALGYGVSRRHAEFRPTNERLLLVDLGSTNRTRLNGAPLRPRDPVKVEDNDIIAFGRLRFQVRIIERPR